MPYVLYIVACADGTYYTGIATDVQRRIEQHNGDKPRGARYTAARRPVTLVYEASFETRSAALKEEIRIKRLTRIEKEALIKTMIASGPPAPIAAPPIRRGVNRQRRVKPEA